MSWCTKTSLNSNSSWPWPSWFEFTCKLSSVFSSKAYDWPWCRWNNIISETAEQNKKKCDGSKWPRETNQSLLANIQLHVAFSWGKALESASMVQLQEPTLIALTGKRKWNMMNTNILYQKKGTRERLLRGTTWTVFWPLKSWFSPSSSVGLRNIYIITWYRSTFEPVHHFITTRTDRYPNRLFKNISWGINWNLDQCRIWMNTR